jgi:hypothetical protein
MGSCGKPRPAQWLVNVRTTSYLVTATGFDPPAIPQKVGDLLGFRGRFYDNKFMYFVPSSIG